MRSSLATGGADVVALLTFSDSEVESARVSAAEALDRANEWRMVERPSIVEIERGVFVV